MRIKTALLTTAVIAAAFAPLTRAPR